MKNNNYICHMPYLRNSLAYEHDLLHLYEMMISPDVFSFFQNFDFPGCWRGGEGNDNLLSASFCISIIIPCMIVVFGAHV